MEQALAQEQRQGQAFAPPAELPTTAHLLAAAEHRHLHWQCGKSQDCQWYSKHQTGHAKAASQAAAALASKKGGTRDGARCHARQPCRLGRCQRSGADAGRGAAAAPKQEVERIHVGGGGGWWRRQPRTPAAAKAWRWSVGGAARGALPGCRAAACCAQRAGPVEGGRLHGRNSVLALRPRHSATRFQHAAEPQLDADERKGGRVCSVNTGGRSN